MKRFIAIALLFLCQFAFGGYEAYLFLDGPSGPIEGSVERAGKEGAILVVSFDNIITSPRNSETGMPTGQRQHMPFKVTKFFDKATPRLLEAFVKNWPLEAELQFYTTTPEGQEYNYYSILLHDAYITSICQGMVTSGNTTLEGEHISFAYNLIEQNFYEDKTAISIEAKWAWVPGFSLRVSDLNFDGTVNILDLSVMAGEWMAGTN
ncbi:MAG: type VI secretion system tube protein Hcp [Sedimentisphaerales bacterium]|nr:type VI secretion system tube protein Hcp [Sedimentisphaerales bacterium]MBN2843417.1 type VI secretion system tube protein Hcp [Sedimentisphaerales bacterium]